MSAFASKLLEYHTSHSGSQIYLDNMKRIHPSLNENDIYGLALLSVNPAIPEEERLIFKKCLEIKAKQQIDLLTYSKRAIDELRRYEDNLPNITECNHQK